MENKNLKYLINIIFKILGLYEKINDKNDSDHFTKVNYIIYIEKLLVDIGGFIEVYKDNEVVSNVLNKCYLSIVGILEIVKSDKDDHKIIKSKVLDMTNDIARCLSEGE